MRGASTAERRPRAAGRENVLVLDAGDQFAGSLFFTTFQGQAEVEFMNRIGFDAMVFGNHEFDLGPGPIADFVEKAEFPVVFGNVEAAGDNRLGPLNRDPVILEVGGTRIGIVGVLTPDTAEIASPGPTVAFGDPVAYLTEAVAALEADGVKHIIALTHQGVVDDLATAAAVGGIDAIVGGHSHTLFSNSVEGAPYPYPTMVEGPGGVAVPVVQAEAYSKYLGHLVLTFDDAGVVTEASGDTVLLDASVTPDSAYLARIAEMGAPIAELMARVVGEVGADIDGSRETCRAGECAMDNLVAEAMLERVTDQGVTVALQNGGGLRASIAAGVVSQGDVLAVLPFQNTLSTFNISGAGVVAALENGVSQVEEGAGRFLQVAGLTYAWDAAAPPMARVREVKVREGENWAPIDPGKTYTVVTNDFVRKGGDGFAVLADEAANAYDFGPGLEDVLADYIAANPGYMPFTDGRIVRKD
ncbi:MAG: 5'-nucleotidase C-terminal domain-containing protein [Rhodobacteraceae bacterium]|nr:5'-nucleotidase C-terminal domain-containing protein [Paracoccaceae bacterium]